MFPTISPVELGEAWRMAAGQLRGAPEGGRQQAGHQRTVAHLCWKTKQKTPARLRLCMHAAQNAAVWHQNSWIHVCSAGCKPFCRDKKHTECFTEPNKPHGGYRQIWCCGRQISLHILFWGKTANRKLLFWEKLPSISKPSSFSSFRET